MFRIVPNGDDDAVLNCQSRDSLRGNRSQPFSSKDVAMHVDSIGRYTVECSAIWTVIFGSDEPLVGCWIPCTVPRLLSVLPQGSNEYSQIQRIRTLSHRPVGRPNERLPLVIVLVQAQTSVVLDSEVGQLYADAVFLKRAFQKSPLNAI